MTKKIILVAAAISLLGLLLVWQYKKAPDSADVDSLPKSRTVNINIDWVPSGEYYGFFYALENGYYKKEGFEVKIVYGNGAPSVAAQVANGSVAIGTTTSDNITTQISRGSTFSKAVGILKYSPTSLVSLSKKEIKNLNGLKGKTIGVNVQASSYSQFLFLLKNSNIDTKTFKEFPIGFGGAAQLENGQVDAFLAYTTNQAVDLELKGKKISELYFGDLGISSYGLALVFANKEHLKEFNISDNDVLKIIRATEKGYNDGAKDVNGAAAALIKYEPSLSSDKLKFVIGKIALLNKSKAISSNKLDAWMSPDDSIKSKSRNLYN